MLSLLLVSVLLLGSCSADKDPAEPLQTETARESFSPIEEIDPCVVEPDERALMSDNDMIQYRRLMNAMLERQSEVTLSDEDRIDFLMDLLRQSPYYYFLRSADIDADKVRFTYAYSAEQ